MKHLELVSYVKPLERGAILKAMDEDYNREMRASRRRVEEAGERRSHTKMPPSSAQGS